MVVGKSSKAISVKIDCQWIIGHTQSIDTHIELPASKEKRIKYISLADIVLGRGVFAGSLPFADLTNFIEDKYALPLAFGCLNSLMTTGFIIHSILSLFCLLNYS